MKVQGTLNNLHDEVLVLRRLHIAEGSQPELPFGGGVCCKVVIVQNKAATFVGIKYTHKHHVDSAGHTEVRTVDANYVVAQ
eukprot:6156010-Amphidinium_carterae.1